MEWYFRNEIEDLVVPKNHEQWEVESSPDSWSPWGITAFGGSDYPKKNFDSPNKVIRQEPKSINPNSSMETDGGTLLCDDHTDYQQFTDEQDRINRMDDLFFNSLLEQEPTKYSTESHDNFDIFEGDFLTSHNIPSHRQCMESSKYLKTHPSTDWENGEVSSTSQMIKQYASEENSMEQSVLQELERVTAQFTDTTRICFRDALYRLAENSKQTADLCQDAEPMIDSNDDTLRGEIREVLESETNAIDRAVANLMYSKICFEDQDNGNADEQQQASYLQTDMGGDAEVPFFGVQESPQPMFNQDAYV